MFLTLGAWSSLVDKRLATAPLLEVVFGEGAGPAYSD